MTTKHRNTSGGRTRGRGTPARQAALVRTTTTAADLERAIDKIVDEVNLKLDEAGLARESAANQLFRESFVNQSALALSPKRRGTEQYRMLQERAGHSLKLTREELREYVLIGALNHRLSQTKWARLDWSVKLELLVLLDPKDGGLAELRRGIDHAAGGGISVRDVRTWIQNEYPQLPGARGRPRGLTVSGGKAIIANGIRLRDDADRGRFAEKIQQLPAAERRRFRKDLEESIENLKKLLGELG